MRKTAKIVISLILIASMLLVPAFAAGAESSNDLKYVSLGDSIAGGIGLPDSPLRGPDQPDKTKVYCNKTIGAYPSLIAAALGVEDKNFTQLACAGMRTVELRACLDPKYKVPDKYANNFMGNELEEWVTDRYNVRSYIKSADVITMNMCANDIASFALFKVREVLNGKGVSNAVIDAAVGCLEKGGEYTTALIKLLDLAAKLGSYAAAVPAAINGLYEGYNRWIENWDAIVGIIYKLNPDVTLVCVGMNNPFNHLKISKNSLIEIGAALDGIVAAINYWSAIGSKYSGRYLYVDIMGIETICEERGNTLTDSDFLNNFELNVHPSEKGQQQIADRIVSKLKQTNSPLCAILNAQVKSSARTLINAYGSKLNKLVGSILDKYFK